MTVCIAAIYNNTSILGISDRMITAGDIKFEPSSKKIFNLSNSIVVMTAGDASIQTELLDSAQAYVNKRISSYPKKWVPVVDVARFYSDKYAELRKDLAEKVILTPLGLTHGTFISAQKDMTREFISDIKYQLQTYKIESVATIVAGIDETGPHIFVVTNEYIERSNRVGFAAIGIGSNHANSHFMLSGYTASTSEANALRILHQAKKKAEASPGVGQDTDMFVIGPNMGTFNIILPIGGHDIIGDLDKFYDKYTAGIKRLDDEAEKGIADYLSKLEPDKPADQATDTIEPIAMKPITKAPKSRKK